jgi:hypothetical protein
MDQKFTPQTANRKRPALERLALNRIRERFPTPRRSGFAQAVFAVDSDLKLSWNGVYR